MDPFSTWGLDLIRALQNLGTWLLTPMQAFTFLGNEIFFMVALPLIFWCVNKALGRDLALLLALANFFNGLVKELCRLPRPFWVDSRLALSAETSFGLPSGHAMNTTTLFGYVATRLQRPWRWLPIVIILLVSISRLYLGMHFPGDVLGGWVLGALLLAGAIWLRPRAAAWLHGLPLGTHVVLALAAALAVLGLYTLVLALPGGDRQTYGLLLFAGAQEATREGSGTLTGMFFGLWVGLVVEARYVRFATAGPLWQRALRYLLGMIGVVGLWAGLKAIFPAEPYGAGLALRAVRYALMMLWTTWFWPWLFMRIGLGQSDAIGPAGRR